MFVSFRTEKSIRLKAMHKSKKDMVMQKLRSTQWGRGEELIPGKSIAKGIRINQQGLASRA